MLLEIVHSGDAENCCGVHSSLHSLFVQLAQLCDPEGGFGQTEVHVIRWESWEERAELRNDRDYMPKVVLYVDELT